MIKEEEEEEEEDVIRLYIRHLSSVSMKWKKERKKERKIEKEMKEIEVNKTENTYFSF